MSARRTYVLCCDADGCLERYVVEHQAPPLVGDVRARASVFGWRHWITRTASDPSKSEDFCSKHRDLWEDRRREAAAAQAGQ